MAASIQIECIMYINVYIYMKTDVDNMFYIGRISFYIVLLIIIICYITSPTTEFLLFFYKCRNVNTYTIHRLHF